MESPKHKKNDKSSKPEEKENGYLKFYGVAIEIVAFNIVCIWGGLKLSELYSPASYWILFLGIALAISGTIYYLLKRVVK